MPCCNEGFGVGDWWQRRLHSDPTDKYLAKHERELLAMARKARRHPKTRQLALGYDIQASTVFNQRVALRIQEERQRLSTAHPKKANGHLKRIEELESRFISIPIQQIDELNARQPSPQGPGAQAMGSGVNTHYPTYSIPSPQPVSASAIYSPPPPRTPTGHPPLPSAPPSPANELQPTLGGESVTYMSSQSISSRAIASSALFPNHSGSNSRNYRDAEVMGNGESPPPYQFHDSHAFIPATKVHVMLGQEH